MQAFCQCHEAFAAQHDMDMLEAAISQPEVIKPMDQGLARDSDAQISHVGEPKVRAAKSVSPMRPGSWT